MSRYVQQRFLGSGTYSHVFLARDTHTNTDVALKRIQVNENDGFPATTLREITILKKLSHANILRLLDVGIAHTECTIVFEYIEYGLYAYMKMVSSTVPLIVQFARGVAYMHAQAVIHRDLKPENILVTKDGVLKIADFNLARTTTFVHRGLSSDVVSLWYRSPELLRGATAYSYFVDIWSFGCVMAEMLGAQPLFMGRDGASQLEITCACTENVHILVAKLKDAVPSQDEDLIHIVTLCLAQDPASRATAEEISRAIETKFG